MDVVISQCNIQEVTICASKCNLARTRRRRDAVVVVIHRSGIDNAAMRLRRPRPSSALESEFVIVILSRSIESRRRRRPETQGATSTQPNILHFCLAIPMFRHIFACNNMGAKSAKAPMSKLCRKHTMYSGLSPPFAPVILKVGGGDRSLRYVTCCGAAAARLLLLFLRGCGD